jgi:hypothetical protein
MEELSYGALAMIPPLVAMILAIWKKPVQLSLLTGR